jgi:hypothetical protein
LNGDRRLLIEGKGRERLKDQAKQTAAGRWVAAVNADGRWGTWSHAVARDRSEVRPAVDTALPASTGAAG